MESKLTYFKWFVEDAELMREQLTTDQVGELFLAVMAYLRDGTVTDVSPAIKWPYGEYQNKVDRSRLSYDKKCTTNAKNGAAGGKAKAQNAKKGQDGATTSPRTKFTPPTKKQFISALEHAIEEGDISEDITEYEIDALFDGLAEKNWTIDGEPILNRTDWETVISVKFPPEHCKTNIQSVLHLYDPVFRYIFKTFHGLRDTSGDTYADFVAADFCEEYDKNISGWNIHGEEFPRARWHEAVEKYIMSSRPELANGSYC